ncbi:MAG: hypothetical protein FJZ01_00680 [Candidatus Sericytochromatia bacterium]|nr:hypothetical protein [Candidatus Tanganyikabacteria bacterium]
MAALAILDDSASHLADPFRATEVITRDDHIAYLERLFLALSGRYRRMSYRVVATPALTTPDRPAPYFEALVAIRGHGKGGRVIGEARAEAGGHNLMDAVSFAELDALRRLAFDGAPIAYCGVLLKRGRLMARLLPVNLEGGTYRLDLIFDLRPRQPWEKESVWIPPERSYALMVRVEPKAPPRRTDYLRIVGGVPADIRRHYGKYLDFGKYPVRLHRLVMALDEESLIDPVGDREAKAELLGIEDSDTSTTYHVHHHRGVGLDNRRAALSRALAGHHARIHVDWADSLNPDSNGLVEVSTRARGVGSKIIMTRSATITDLSLDNLVGWHRALLQRQAAIPTGMAKAKKWAKADRAEIDEVLAITGRSDGRRSVSKIVRAVQEAGGRLSFSSILFLTSVDDSSADRWLRKLIETGIMAMDKVEGDRVFRLVKDVPVPFPIPRRRC